ncbi:MAG: glycosyltransferase [bacterium]
MATGNPFRTASFSNEFLPYSQSFIYLELTNHIRYRVEAFARKRKSEKHFPFEPVHTAGNGNGIKAATKRFLYTTIRHSGNFSKIFKSRPFSLIHAQFGPSAVYAEPFAKKYDLPLICTFGGIDVAALEAPLLKKPDYWFYRVHAPSMFKRVDRVLAVSKNLADRLVAVGMPKDKVHVFYRGIEIPESVPERNRTSDMPAEFLMVGRLVEKKGFFYGLKAFAEGIKEGKKAKMHIIGSGPMEKNLKNSVRKNNIEKHVSFSGQLSQKEVFSAMNKADILIVPSITPAGGDTEGVPNVIKEANSRALPAVVSNHGGLPEVVNDGITGFITAEKDIRKLKDRMFELAGNPSLRIAMGKAARKLMCRDFDIKSKISVLENHYDDVFHSYYASRRKSR